MPAGLGAAAGKDPRARETAGVAGWPGADGDRDSAEGHHRGWEWHVLSRGPGLLPGEAGQRAVMPGSTSGHRLPPQRPGPSRHTGCPATTLLLPPPPQPLSPASPRVQTGGRSRGCLPTTRSTATVAGRRGCTPPGALPWAGSQGLYVVGTSLSPFYRCRS